MNQLLFVYGTLLQPGNEHAAYLRRHSKLVSAGKVKGVLYDIGDYPGLILYPSAGHVQGSIYSIDTEALKLIDAYEGFGPGEYHPNLYLRIMQPVETESGFVDAWVYIYNLPVEGLIRIEDGDYPKYMAQKKSPGS